ncbi:MAG: DUF1638 domain-containing protein [Abditibacteriota bacterium]|nr:DUF1638 domain-containing protein [Abditibacteriota bacterium]
MKLRILACGVFEPYLDRLTADKGDSVSCVSFDAGLHETPDLLRQTVQDEIDRISREGEDYDAIVLFYGLCGRGTGELVSREIPILIPRVHDCIALFMGSDAAYKKEFGRNPGTFYHTLGWLVKKINPNEMAAIDLYRNYDKIGWEQHPEYGRLEGKYGESNAEYILQFAASWQKNYSRGAYIDMGFGEDEYAAQTEVMARAFGWKYERIKGDMGFLRELFRGVHSDRVFVLPPFSVSKASGDDRIFNAVSAGESEHSFYETETVLYSEGESPLPKGVGLGIDAGGTYTDAVIFDFARRVVIAKAKALTTYEDLLIGINEALSKLPAEYLRTVQVTSLSTTLATNAIVEGRGSRVGTILYSPFERFAEDAGLSPCIQVRGALDISGAVLEDIDPEEVLAAADTLVRKEKCRALCVGGYASLRNPELSVRIRDIIRDKYPELSVICSHDISQKLNAVNSLKTAAANARLIPVISSLIHSVRRALDRCGVRGRLMIVKGDGTCVNTDAALERPIETVLSGPASSVSGARLLTGIKDAIVADVGGTTTDIAVLKDGLVDISQNGALVGGSVMQINAVSINTSGLGGDSRISFSRDRHITVGPVRNVPICSVAAAYPQVAGRLKDMSGRKYSTAPDTSQLDVLLYSPFWERVSLSPDETRLCGLLKEKGAMFASDARDALGLASNELLHLPALEAAGAIKRSHLTPTDLFHIQGRMSKWDTESALNALKVFAMLLGTDPEDLTERIWRQIRYMLLSQLLQRELTDETGRECALSGESEYMIRGITDERKGGVAFSLSLPHPLIAIGAPVKDMFEGFDKYVHCPVIIPEHADVANAVGAVSGEIIARETVYIRPGNDTGYIVYSSQKRLEENTLSGATATGLELCKELARAKSLAAGAREPLVRVTVKDRISHTTDGGLLFVERLLTGQGSGASIEATQEKEG